MDRTDHSQAIAAMREEARVAESTAHLMEDGRFKEAMLRLSLIHECAAALLEVHDDTGISLDDWKGPRELVEYALKQVAEEFTENHV